MLPILQFGEQKSPIFTAVIYGPDRPINQNLKGQSGPSLLTPAQDTK